MITYILLGMIIISNGLFALHILMAREVSISQDAYVNALKDYIKSLERYIEILRQEIEIYEKEVNRNERKVICK